MSVQWCFIYTQLNECWCRWGQQRGCHAAAHGVCEGTATPACISKTFSKLHLFWNTNAMLKITGNTMAAGNSEQWPTLGLGPQNLSLLSFNPYLKIQTKLRAADDKIWGTHVTGWTHISVLSAPCWLFEVLSPCKIVWDNASKWHHWGSAHTQMLWARCWQFSHACNSLGWVINIRWKLR